MPEITDTAVNAIAALEQRCLKTEIIEIDLTRYGRQPIADKAELVVLIDNDGRRQIQPAISYSEAYLQRPIARKGMAKTVTADSFIDLVNRHKDPDSALFGDPNWKKPGIIAVIDYHNESDGTTTGEDLDPYARHCRHRIAYEFPLDEIWQQWLGQSGKAMTQHDFAEWIEDHIVEISSPTEAEINAIKVDFGGEVATAAKIMELSRGLQVFENSNVKQAIRLASGEAAITFETTHKDASGEPLKVPDFFILKVPVFVGGPAVRLPVRLRYRVKDGKLYWFFMILRPDLYIDGEVTATFERIRNRTGLPLYLGSPEV